MREAVGSTFLFKLMIVFIFFFTAFLAIAINYAQAFKTKNAIINALEQSEGYDNARTRIADIKNSSNYYREGIDCSNHIDDGKTFFTPIDMSGLPLNGICIARTVGGTTGSAYYTVKTFIHFNLPIIGDLVTIPVIGETKLIVNDNCTGC